MFGGQHLWKYLGVWLALLSYGSLGLAQNTFPRLQGPSFVSPQIREFPQAKPSDRVYIGMMGQVARPGVYELPHPEMQLVDVIQHAGGLTRQAANRIEIVRDGKAEWVTFSPTLYFPLVAGDIVVVEEMMPSQNPSLTPTAESLIHNADFEQDAVLRNPETQHHVALMNVLDRPVILPVPATHANVPAVVAYLGQDSAMAASVQVLPVGQAEFPKEDAAASAAIVGPTVLYFNPRSIRRDQLPKFPDVYQVRDRAESTAHKPLEWKTTELIPVPVSPSAMASTLPRRLPIPSVEQPVVERFQRPSQNSVKEGLFHPSATALEPPLMAEVRELERQIPAPDPLSAKILSEEEMRASTVPFATPDNPEENSSSEQAETSTFWWSFLGWVLLVVASGGLYWKLRQRQPLPDSSQTPAVPPIPLPARKPFVAAEQQAQATIQAPVGLGKFITEESLAALVFNQLPVREELSEPALPEQKPAGAKPRKVFRLDPPEEQATTAKKPYIAKGPKPTESQPAKITTAPPVPEETVPFPRIRPLVPRSSGPPPEEANEASSILDRVLRRVHQNRAA